MGDVIRVGWFVDPDGRTYLGRLTDEASKVEPTTMTREAKKAAQELRKRLGRAERQA
jgi:hypothetical protein